jgi:hypothetical protein
LYHEIHNEPEKAQVLSELAAWLNIHVWVLRGRWKLKILFIYK